MNFLHSFILFSTIGQMLPVCVRGWAYDARYNAWAHCPKFGDLLAKAHGCPNFDYAAFRRSRALERDSVILSRAQFNAKHNRSIAQVQAV